MCQAVCPGKTSIKTKLSSFGQFFFFFFFLLVLFFFFSVLSSMISYLVRAPLRSRSVASLRAASQQPLRQALSTSRLGRSVPGQQQHQQQPLYGRIPSLLDANARTRSFSYAPAPALALNHQIRFIGFSSIPRLTMHALRVPALIAGTTVAGVTVANSKINGTYLFFFFFFYKSMKIHSSWLAFFIFFRRMD